MPAVLKPGVHHDPAYRKWIAGHECILCGMPSECCHFRNRRMWGDHANCFPCCHYHHIEVQHRIGIKSFQARYNLDLAAICAAFGEAFSQGKP
jgi:hypothetical protein